MPRGPCRCRAQETPVTEAWARARVSSPERALAPAKSARRVPPVPRAASARAPARAAVVAVPRTATRWARARRPGMAAPRQTPAKTRAVRAHAGVVAVQQTAKTLVRRAPPAAGTQPLAVMSAVERPPAPLPEAPLRDLFAVADRRTTRSCRCACAPSGDAARSAGAGSRLRRQLGRRAPQRINANDTAESRLNLLRGWRRFRRRRRA